MSSGPTGSGGSSAGPTEGPSSRVPFGAWPSPLSAELAAQGGVRLGGLAMSRDADGLPLVWWSALSGGANQVFVARGDGEPVRVEAVTSARSRLNEYGGGAFWVSGERLFWVDDDDQRIRVLDGAPRAGGAGEVVVLTPEAPVQRAFRYAAGAVAPAGDWMVVEREVHCAEDGTPLAEPAHDLAVVATDGSMWVRSVVSGADFVASPVLSPGGTELAWLQWDHPSMPWDSASLWAAGISVDTHGEVELSTPRRVAGGATGGAEVSACLPSWDEAGRLWWCDDRDGRWVLRRFEEAGLPAEGAGDRVPAFWDGGGEVGTPRWVSGQSRYGSSTGPQAAPGDDPTVGRVVLVESREGFDHLVVLAVGPDGPTVADSGSLALEPGWIDAVVVGREDVAGIAGAPDTPTSVVIASLSEHPDASGLRRPAVDPWPLGRESISMPEPVTFPTGPPGEPRTHADDGQSVAHGLFYPPRLDGCAGSEGELPPLVVRIHGGPTAAARAELSSSVQYWTTRGFAVVEVNYRGSTGYGRDYRNQLRGGWGEVEVEDCISAAEHLAAAGRVDPRRCVIRGGSAGGFTALEALCAPVTPSGFRFAAATTLYGVTDLMALAADTHKFESRYLDGLVGPLPEAEATYRERSPRWHPERIAAPVLILQGLDDPIVPPAQAEELVAALASAGVDHEYRTYAGEGHGFRNPATIVDALGAELAFYRRVLGI